MTSFTDDPLYAAIEAEVLRRGGWLDAASSVGYSPESLKRMARSATLRRDVANMLGLSLKRNNPPPTRGR